MDNIVLMFVILFVIIVVLIIAVMTFCSNTPNNKTENFTPWFVQVYPKIGEVPLSVDFVPIYENEYTPFVIDFGDGSSYNGMSTAGHTHTYMKRGTYNGVITFMPTNSTQIEPQQFRINVM